MDHLLGQRVGPYQLVRRLGVGGMGAVYLAQHVEDGGTVAVKVLHRRLLDNVAVVRRFLDEARAVNRIDHPGIVRIFECDRSPELGVYLVMEHLRGQTLKERWSEHGNLAPRAVARITQQVAEALSQAHALGVVHRDIKPSNIFLVPDAAVRDGERAKVLDFGVAKLLLDGHAATVTGALIGTLVYMSPEQRLDSKNVDERTDIYSLGVVAYGLLSGRHPLDQETLSRAAPHLDLSPAPIQSVCPGVPDELAWIIMKTLAPRREDRFASMAELRDALQPVLDVLDEEAEAAALARRTFPLERPTVVEPPTAELQRESPPLAATATDTELGAAPGAEGAPTMLLDRGASIGRARRWWPFAAALAAALGLAVVIGLHGRGVPPPAKPDASSPLSAPLLTPDAAVRDGAARLADAGARADAAAVADLARPEIRAAMKSRSERGKRSKRPRLPAKLPVETKPAKPAKPTLGDGLDELKPLR